jgi:MFS transporter, DHA1 family, multidrug resistance protein
MIISYFLPYSVSLITISSAMMFFGTGFIFPMSMGKGISLFRHIAGTATATMYLINVLITGLTSFVVSLLNIHSAISLMWLYFTLMLITENTRKSKTFRCLIEKATKAIARCVTHIG